MEDERRALAARMTDKAAKLLLDMPLRQMRRLEEMRFYAGQNACFVFDGRGETQNVFFSQRDVDELVTALCGHSRYAYETQLAQGYIPLGNGCRAGVCGRVTTGESGRLSSPTSVCIRVARDVPGASGGVSDADLGGCAMNIDLLFQIAGVGILIFAVNQVLQKAGREDIAVLASVAGLVVVMFLVVDLVAQLLNNVKSIFGLY